MKIEFLKSNIKSGDHKKIGRNQIWIGIILILLGVIKHLSPLSTNTSHSATGTIASNFLTLFDLIFGNHTSSIILYTIGGILIIFGIIIGRKKT